MQSYAVSTVPCLCTSHVARNVHMFVLGDSNSPCWPYEAVTLYSVLFSIFVRQYQRCLCILSVWRSSTIAAREAYSVLSVANLLVRLQDPSNTTLVGFGRTFRDRSVHVGCNLWRIVSRSRAGPFPKYFSAFVRSEQWLVLWFAIHLSSASRIDYEMQYLSKYSQENRLQLANMGRTFARKHGPQPRIHFTKPGTFRIRTARILIVVRF